MDKVTVKELTSLVLQPNGKYTAKYSTYETGVEIIVEDVTIETIRLTKKSGAATIVL